jgi:hypothetical protein
MNKVLYLTLALSLASLAVADQSREFVAVPGVQEFSGEMIVRPSQNLDPARMRRAVTRIQANVLRSYP